jgi:hypothetical protein
MKHYSTATPKQAREWLIKNDPEAAAYWPTVADTEVIAAMGENLQDFGADSEWTSEVDHPLLAPAFGNTLLQVEARLV